jgi:hypothetical protein
MTMSSTNRMSDVKGGPSFIPFNLPKVYTAFNNLLSPSTTRRKMWGDSGKTCLLPLLDLKKGDVEPLMMITKGAKLV